MGGKKKSLANRLARMTDEERARYLQHKADVEEEAKRRKEQLIAIFMKNKIKKEEGFSRLNLAKINQQWHQILRLNKCKEMKEDVEHMKNHINRVLNYKNRVIDTLLGELEMAEEQYAHNFQVHYIKINQIICDNDDYVSNLNQSCKKIVEQLLEVALREQKITINKSKEDTEHLKTVIFKQNAASEEKDRNAHENFLKKQAEITSTFQLRLKSLIKDREENSSAIWKQIAEVINQHVTQTDIRRLHLAELKRLDAESKEEIASNQERINSQEAEIKILKQQFEELNNKHAHSIDLLNKTIAEKTKIFVFKRQLLRKNIDKDDIKLKFLTATSNYCLSDLEKVQHKGKQSVSLMNICKKFETEKEQILKWIPLATQTSIEDQSVESTSSKSNSSTEGNEYDQHEIVNFTSSSPTDDYRFKEEFIKREFGSIFKMEQFWMIYGKTNLEFKQLVKEKKSLLQENKQLRGMIRAVLEAVALNQSTPNSKVSTRVASMCRSLRSAPVRGVLM